MNTTMNSSLARRIAFASVATMVAALGTTGASAAPSHRALEVLGSRSAVANADLPLHARKGSGVAGVLNAGALSASEVMLVLPDGREVQAQLQRVLRDDRRGVQSWVGVVEKMPGSLLVLTRANGVIAGFGNFGTETIEIRPYRDGRHLVFAVDNARLPQVEQVSRPTQSSADTQGVTVSDLGAGSSVPDAAAAAIQDVLVVYTAASSSRHGQATLESMVQSAVQAANQAYSNSQIAVTMNLVGTHQVDVSEGSSMGATLSALQSSSSVSRLRDQLAADVVVLVSENSDNCGLAFGMTSNTTGFAPNAFGVVYSSCLSNQSLAHEVGHIQGVMHNRENSTFAGAYPYGYGYRVCASDGTGFRDIMSYSCSGAPRVLLFSNPSVSYNGYPSGISYEASPATSAENTRAINNTASTVAAFRTSSLVGTSTVPGAPSGMTLTNIAYNQVTTSWNDNATNESGFKVERSVDGVGFTEIASLGIGSQAFTDLSVAPRSTYYYRVRAFNSSGVSAYSNTVNLTTPDVPPPPPSAPATVAANNNGDGTSMVSWNAGDSAASNFDVRREKWDSRKRVWSGATIAATVPGSVLSIIDSTGAGEYRYYVRASNSGGASSYAGPAQVLVTSLTNSTKKAPPGKGR